MPTLQFTSKILITIINNSGKNKNVPCCNFCACGLSNLARFFSYPFWVISPEMKEKLLKHDSKSHQNSKKESENYKQSQSRTKGHFELQKYIFHFSIDK